MFILALKPRCDLLFFDSVVITVKLNVHPRGGCYYLPLFDVILGSLHIQQLHGFDKLRNDKKKIQTCTVKINTAMASL
jgi:hypothetical protein